MHVHLKDGSLLTLSDDTQQCLRYQSASGDHTHKGAPIGYECMGVVMFNMVDAKPTLIADFLRHRPGGSYELTEGEYAYFSLKMVDPSSGRAIFYGPIRRIFTSDNRPTIPASRDSGLMRAVTVDPFATTVPGGESTGTDEPK